MWVGAVGAIRFNGFWISGKVRDSWRNTLNPKCAVARTAVWEVLGSMGFAFAIGFGSHGGSGWWWCGALSFCCELIITY